jgi:hypothetical protein
MTSNESLDLRNGTVICALMALDTELSQFHYLCMEQGPFFKFFFDEFTTDAHRKALQQTLPALPGCAPHVSHYGRYYWKPQIEKKQILAIHGLFSKFQQKWQELYAHFNVKFYYPQAEPSVLSPWTLLNEQLVNFSTNICAICSQLANTSDPFHEASGPEHKYRVTVIEPNLPRASLDTLLQSLGQLYEK